MKKTRLSRHSRAKKRKHEKSKYLRKSVSNAELLRNQTLEKSMIEILPFYAILFFVSLLLFECFERFCSLMPAYLSLSLPLSFFLLLSPGFLGAHRIRHTDNYKIRMLCLICVRVRVCCGALVHDYCTVMLYVFRRRLLSSSSLLLVYFISFITFPILFFLVSFSLVCL